MPLMATLIANPASPSLSASLGIKASAAVNATGLYWLADGIACDIALRTGSNVTESYAELARIVDGEPIDIVVQDQDTRRKKSLSPTWTRR